MSDIDIIDALVEMSYTAPELCPSCKHLENDETMKRIGWDKWCSRLTTSVTRVWLCTAYEKIESEGE